MAETTSTRAKATRSEAPQRPTLPPVLGARSASYRDLYYFLLRAPWWQVFALISILFLALNALFGLAYFELGGVKGAAEGSFLDAFFFSVQTMGTIGYGAMYPASLAAHVLVTIEAIIGLVTTAMVTGLAFAKFSRPHARVMFANRVTIALRDGRPTLMVRVANERSNHIADAQMRLAILSWEITAEGERVRRIHDLQLVRSQTPAFMLTWTGLHVIDERSPLHGLTPDDLVARNIQLIVTIIGHDETFASTIHARYSYSADQFVWNKRFADVMLTTPEGTPIVDYRRFHELVDNPPIPVVTAAA